MKDPSVILPGGTLLQLTANILRCLDQMVARKRPGVCQRAEIYHYGDIARMSNRPEVIGKDRSR